MSTAVAPDWRATAAQIEWDIRPFIDGALRDSHSQDRLENVNPATGDVLCTFAAGSAEDVDSAVRAARVAFDDGRWSNLGSGTRRSLLLALADKILACAPELALLDSLEMGKPISQALFDSGQLAPAFARYCGEVVDKIQGLVGNTEPSMLALSLPEPRGVVAAITPWNFPLVNAVIKLAPALAAGNCIVLKPSEQTSSSALRIGALAAQVGIPPGVINIVPGSGHTLGTALARHPGVDFLSFTGSTKTGCHVMTASGETAPRPLLLECGGKSPCVIFDDITDLDAVAAQICAEALWNQGQLCVARSRFIIHERIMQPLLAAIRARIEQIAPGDPLDPETAFGGLASRQHRSRVLALVERGLRAGARPFAGEPPAGDAPGCDMAPLVFTDVGCDNPLWREEVFGPVIVVQGFADRGEAIRLANDSDYGLAASVWTRDLETAHHMARAIRAGEVCIYSAAAAHEGPGFSLPQEGRKNSGFGAETGVEGIRSYMTWKKVEFHTPRSSSYDVQR